jgi:hypothetical protein
MKKLIAGIVMSALLFMALATGAFAKTYKSDIANKASSSKGNGSCTAYDWYVSTEFSC